MSFRIWYNAASGIADVDVVQANTYGGNLNESNPAPGLRNGSSGESGNVVGIGFCAGCADFPFPSDWVLNQWVNVANVSYCTNNNCSPAGFPAAAIIGTNVDIQGFFQGFPNIGVDFTDYQPSQGPLPLNLISFNARKSGETNAHITWTTANEENTSHFIVQRSFDKYTWQDIGSVAAAGYSISILNYELFDANVNSGRSSRLQVYYRLKMFDLDGSSRLSPIQSVVFNNGSATKSNEFLVYPNPATDGVQVEWSSENIDIPTSFEIYDVTGKFIYRQEILEKTNQAYIDFGPAKLQSGLYLLRVLSGTKPIDHQQIVVDRGSR